MLLNKPFKLSVLALAIFSLTACQTLRGKGANEGGAQVADAASAGGATSTGVGEATSFAGDTNQNQMQGQGQVLTVNDQTYYFDFDKSNVHESDKSSIDTQAQHLSQHPAAKVVLEGHTDPRGSREYNIALGQRRADSVAEMLKLQGAGKNQLSVVSYGAETALAGTTEQDYQLDRRVHLKYEDKG